MSAFDNRAPSTRHYFVDEAGDGTLFNGKGQVLIGSEGCSRFFILGLVDIPFHLVQDIDDTRQTRYGVYYAQKKPLSAAALVDRPLNTTPGI
jgi:hypothetical protein